MRKRRKSKLIRNCFDRRKFRRQCANTMDTMWGCIYFLTCTIFRLSVQRSLSCSVQSICMLTYFSGWYINSKTFCQLLIDRRVGNYMLVFTLMQRFSIPVLAPHRSAHFVCYSYHFRRLFYSNASALRSGHHTIFLHDSSSKRTYSIHSALKCARREFKLYIFTDVYDVTLVRA